MSKRIIDLDNKKAFKFFLDPESYLSLPLPTYFDFKPVLEYVKDIDSQINKDNAFQTFQSIINKQVNPGDHEDINHIIQINKDGKLAFRRISITNPFIYYFLVKSLTEEEHWELIKERFRIFSEKADFIHVSSIPSIKSKKDKTIIGVSISNWWDGLEQESLRKSLQYQYCIQTDITNCYPSIYVHSLSWALHDLQTIKTLQKDKKWRTTKNNYLGTQVEEYILSMQNRETVGIPLGSIAYDFLAEILLGYIDSIFADEIKKEKIDIEILRYRDDYRIFGNDLEKLNRSLVLLQKNSCTLQIKHKLF